MKHRNVKKSAFEVARERKIATELRDDASGTRNSNGDFKVPKKCSTSGKKEKKRKHLDEAVTKASPDKIEGDPIEQEKVRKENKNVDRDAADEEAENSLQCEAHKKRKKDHDFYSSNKESFDLNKGDGEHLGSNNLSQSVAENSVYLDTKEVAPNGDSSSLIGHMSHRTRSGSRSVAVNEKPGSNRDSDWNSDKNSQLYEKDKSSRKQSRSRSEKTEERSRIKRDWYRDSARSKNLNRDSDKSLDSYKYSDNSTERTSSGEISRSRSKERSSKNPNKAKQTYLNTHEESRNDTRDIQMDYDSERKKRHPKPDEMEKDRARSSSTEWSPRQSSRKEKDSKNSRSFGSHDSDHDIDDQCESQCQKSDEHLSRKKYDTMELAEAWRKERSVAFKTSTGAVHLLCHPQELCMKGRVAVRVICGAVSILGYTLRESDKFYNIYSPESSSLLTITTVSATDDIDDVLRRSEDLVLKPKKIAKYLKCYKGQLVVLQLRRLESYVCDHLTTIQPFQNLFGKYGEKFEGINVVLSPLGVTLHEVSRFKRESRFPTLMMTEDYQYVMDHLTDLLSQRDSSQPVIVTCGGKNSGKSTLNRLLVNSALTQVDKLCYLECDLGQTEFTPPGCVSLHVLTKPVFGPPFSHQKQAVSCCFHGDLTPSSDPDWYLMCIQQVLKHYQQMADSVPLIVNTMGWVKGLGLQLLLDILHMLQPTIVIQLESQNQTQNCSALTPQLVTAEQSWSQVSGSSTTCEMNNLNYQLIGLESVVMSSIEHVIKLKPVDHRNLTLLSYLCQNIEPGVTLYSMVPTVLPWQSVAIHVANISVPKSQVMYAINASVVALCCADLSEAYRLDEESPMFFEKTPVHQCLGFGFIRCIDPEKKLLYLVTPLSFKTLEKVNTLIKGAVSLPDSVLLNQKSGLELAYVDDSLTTLGASSLKQRKHMPRRYAMERR